MLYAITHSCAMDGPQFLQALLDLRGLNPNSMAKKAGNHALQSTVARFLGGNQSRRSTMQPVADFFGVDVGGFYDPDKARLELQRLGSAGKAMAPAVSTHSNTAPGPEIRGKVPLISWVRAGELCETHDNYHPGDAEHWMDCPVPHGPRTYCLEISGDSMDDGGADAYRDGEIIFVDPDASPDPGRDVVVRTPDNKTTFKRLKEDTEGRYLLGLNGKKIVRVPEDTVFCGVVIFSGRRR